MTDFLYFKFNAQSIKKVTTEGFEPSLTEPKSVVLSIKLCGLFIYDLQFMILDCKNNSFPLKSNP